MTKKIKQLRLGMLHYHWLTGGVRTVVSNTLKSLIAYGGGDILELDLISSDAQSPSGEALAKELRQWADEQDCGEVVIRQIELPELAYRREPFRGRSELVEQARKWANQLLGQLELGRSSIERPYVLHVHNLNLGKSALATLGVRMLAERFAGDNMPAWVLYQMHDFAEDNRPDCWRVLRDCTGVSDANWAVEMMYPCRGRIHWSVINSTDRKKLIAAGLPEDRVSLLPNAIDTRAFSTPPLASLNTDELAEQKVDKIDFRDDLRNRLAEFAAENGFTFDKERKLWLMPVKAIRRKNVSEAVLLLLMMNCQKDEHQLLITLPANSEADLEYAGQLERLVKNNKLPVMMSFGYKVLAGVDKRKIERGRVQQYGLVDLLDICQGVLTTSVQEGFGYAFHEPWLASRAVMGRNISQVTDDFKAAGMRLEHLYEKVLVPGEWVARFWDDIVVAYGEKLNNMRVQAGMAELDDSHVVELVSRHKRHYQDGENGWRVDWADLLPEVQLVLLQDIMSGNGNLAAVEVVGRSGDKISQWQKLPDEAIISRNLKVVSEQYGLPVKSRNLLRLIALGNDGSGLAGSGSDFVDNRVIFEQALNLEMMRLLV